MYIPKNFRLQELLPAAFYNVHESLGAKLWLIFDYRALRVLQALRDRYGRIFINNWANGGTSQYSGWRPWDCPIGAELSQHKFGRAFDCHFLDTTAEEVRADFQKSISPLYYPMSEYIRAIELDVSWFHFDVRNTGKDEILFFKP